MCRPIGVKFCTVISTKPNFIMPVKISGGPPPKKIQGSKTCKIWPDFGRLQSSTTNISKTDENIQNKTSTFRSAIPPALGEKSSVNFGPLIM